MHAIDSISRCGAVDDVADRHPSPLHPEPVTTVALLLVDRSRGVRGRSERQ
jgi:hypothetical protein